MDPGSIPKRIIRFRLEQLYILAAEFFGMGCGESMTATMSSFPDMRGATMVRIAGIMIVTPAAGITNIIAVVMEDIEVAIIMDREAIAIVVVMGIVMAASFITVGEVITRGVIEAERAINSKGLDIITAEAEVIVVVAAATSDIADCQNSRALPETGSAFCFI